MKLKLVGTSATAMCYANLLTYCCVQRLKQVKLKGRHESIIQRVLQSCIWMLGTGMQMRINELPSELG